MLLEQIRRLVDTCTGFRLPRVQTQSRDQCCFIPSPATVVVHHRQQQHMLRSLVARSRLLTMATSYSTISASSSSGPVETAIRDKVGNAIGPRVHSDPFLTRKRCS
jgi:hypothetical protein